MKLKGVNASSVKTIALIRQTFAELMEEKKEINSITVTELVKRAGLTRGAFYSHFENIYEVAAMFQDEIMKEVFEYKNLTHTKKDISIYFDNIFKYLKENESIYSKLLVSTETQFFVNRITKKIHTSLQQMLHTQKLNLDIIFFTDGTIDLIVKYFKKEIDEDLDTICKYVKKKALELL